MFGANQMNLIGVHAAQLGDVEGECGQVGGSGCGRGACGRCRRALHRGIGASGEVSAAGQYVEPFGPEAGVEAGGARNERGVVALLGVHAGAGDLDAALADAVAGQRVAAPEGSAGGQSEFAGVDEAAAGAGDAGGIGDDDLRPRSGYFEQAAELAGGAGVDFVEDEARTARAHPGVAGNGAGELGDAPAGGVVEDGAGRGNVKLAVGVVADAIAVGGLDVDERNAVAGGQNGGALCDRGIRVGNDLRLCRSGGKEEGKQGEGSEERVLRQCLP